MNRCALLLGLCLLSGCGGCSPGAVKPPGDEVLGTFALHSKGIFSACSLSGLPPASYDWTGTFSRFSDGGRVFFVVDGELFDAGFDGQFASFSKTEMGNFGFGDGGSCSQCEMKQVQSATLALLSRSQSMAVGDVCPTNFLDGGVPAADPDAGITLPRRLEDGGFDAVLACGELQLMITGEGFCDSACYSCKLQYRINGQRK